MKIWIVGVFFMLFNISAAFAATPLTLRDMADILPEWPVTATESGGQLVLSDSPEQVEREGILYQDLVQGDTRVFFHHVNGMPESKRIIVMLINKGKTAAKVDLNRYGVSSPDRDYLHAGRSIQADYFRDSKQQKFIILPGKSLRLPPTAQIPIVAPQAILTGMLDFSCDQELQVVVAAAPLNADPMAFISQSAVLPPGKPHLRGTFEYADRLMTANRSYNPSLDGPVAITLGDGDHDGFLQGWDATKSMIVRNDGNYGLLYRLTIPTTGKGKIRCYLNPRGGVYSGWLLAKTKLGEKLVATPSKTPGFGHSTMADFELVAEFNAGETLQITLSPPGASNLPVRLMLLPGT